MDSKSKSCSHVLNQGHVRERKESIDSDIMSWHFLTPLSAKVSFYLGQAATIFLRKERAINVVSKSLLKII